MTTCLDYCILSESIWRQLQAAEFLCLLLSQGWTRWFQWHTSWLHAVTCLIDVCAPGMLCTGPSRLVTSGRAKNRVVRAALLLSEAS